MGDRRHPGARSVFSPQDCVVEYTDFEACAQPRATRMPMAMEMELDSPAPGEGSSRVVHFLGGPFQPFPWEEGVGAEVVVVAEDGVDDAVTPNVTP